MRVVRKDHPRFFPTACWRSARVCVAALALAWLACLPGQAVAAASGNFRLAGTVAVGPDYLGVLELPSGEQVLVRKGSTVSGGRVVALDATHLRLELPDRAVNLVLDGSGAAPTLPPSLGVVQESHDEGSVMIRRVDPEAFTDSVAGEKHASATSGSSAPAKRRDPAAEAGQRLAPILNLPPDSRITAVNEQPVRSADQAIKLIEQSLQAGVSPRLNIDSAGGESRLYMSPQRP
jgi:hypothetical protein